MDREGQNYYYKRRNNYGETVQNYKKKGQYLGKCGQIYGKSVKNYSKNGQNYNRRGQNSKGKTNINVITFNTWGLTNPEYILEFELAVEKIKFDSEIRREGEKLQKWENGNYFYYSGQSKGYRGTGFYIHRQWVGRVAETKSISERICTVLR